MSRALIRTSIPLIPPASSNVRASVNGWISIRAGSVWSIGLGTVIRSPTPGPFVCKHPASPAARTSPAAASRRQTLEDALTPFSLPCRSRRQRDEL